MADNSEEKPIRVEVAFAMPGKQEIIELNVMKGCTAEEAVALSQIQQLFPDINLEKLQKGIFSRPLNGRELPLPRDYVLHENDRVEIYRPLENDPKQARMERVNRARQGKAK